MRGLIYLGMLQLFGFTTIMSQQYCYNTDSNPYRNYITKTKYAALNVTPLTSRGDGYGHVSGCEPAVFYILARHGSRYLSKNKILLLSEKLPEFKNYIASHNQQSSLCQDDLNAINDWTMRMIPDDDQILVAEGWNELRNIAKDYKEIYPSLLNVSYNKDQTEFVHSYTSSMRTKDSAKAFAEGLYGPDVLSNLVTTELATSSDWLLRFYVNCLKYQKEIAKQPIKEKEAFSQGQEMNSVLRSIEARMGLSNGNLSLDDMEILYDACSFEYAVYADSPWCALFTKENLEVIEYYNDIRYYWNDMYGHELNYKQTCRLLKDVMRSLRMTNEESPGTIISRFGHSGSLNAFLARIGLYKDDQPFTANGYAEQKNRRLKTSKICPMAGNIVFVLHKCSEDASANKIGVFVNQEPVDLPIDGCSLGVCSVSSLQKVWDPIVADCDIDKMCDLTSISGTSLLLASWKLLLILIKSAISFIHF